MGNLTLVCVDRRLELVGRSRPLAQLLECPHKPALVLLGFAQGFELTEVRFRHWLKVNLWPMLCLARLRLLPAVDPLVSQRYRGEPAADEGSDYSTFAQLDTGQVLRYQGRDVSGCRYEDERGQKDHNSIDWELRLKIVDRSVQEAYCPILWVGCHLLPFFRRIDLHLVAFANTSLAYSIFGLPSPPL